MREGLWTWQSEGQAEVGVGWEVCCEVLRQGSDSFPGSGRPCGFISVEQGLVLGPERKREARFPEKAAGAGLWAGSQTRRT